MPEPTNKPRGASAAPRVQTAPPAAKQKGAQKRRFDMADRRRSWTRHHLDTARDAWFRLWQTPLSTLMTAAVLAISLALPGALLTGLDNLFRLSENLGTEPRLSLYLQLDLPEENIQQLQQKLQQRADFREVLLISPQEGLEQFAQSSGLSDVFNYLDYNPLPAVLVLLPDISDAKRLKALQTQLESLPEVEEAVLDLEWIERLSAFIQLATRTVLVIGALLTLTVVLVVGNTIRLAIESRRDEIVVSKLVGATDAWVRRPFLYSGGWLGLLGAALAWQLVQVSLMLLDQPVEQVALLYHSDFSLSGLGFQGSLLLLLSGILLGWAGSWLAVGKHLKEIQPK